LGDVSKNRASDPETSSVLAKLVKSRGFGRGDFMVLQGPGNGIIVKNLAISDANESDKGKEHKEGEFFHITRYPTNQQYAGDQHYVNAPTRKVKMIASPVYTEKDNIDQTSTVAPAEPTNTLKNMVTGLLSVLKQTGPECKLAPTTLKDAVKRLKETGGSKPGEKYKSLPPNGEVVEDPDTGKRKFLGAHVEYDENGNVNISANNKGLTVDNDGNVLHEGKTNHKEAASEPHSLAGLSTEKSKFADIRPNTFIMPVGLGPLALDRIPNLSLINWALKVFSLVGGIKDVIGYIDEYKDAKKEAKRKLQEMGEDYTGPKPKDINISSVINDKLEKNKDTYDNSNNIGNKIQ